jgi:hypothetical protein
VNMRQAMAIRSQNGTANTVFAESLDPCIDPPRLFARQSIARSLRIERGLVRLLLLSAFTLKFRIAIFPTITTTQESRSTLMS